MRMNRRNVLVGLGTIVAGGGAALGTGAFSSVEADRSVNIETASDSDALLGIDITEADLEGSGDTIEFDLSNDLNLDALTRFDDALEITNNGTDNVDITIEDESNTGLSTDDSSTYDSDNNQGLRFQTSDSLTDVSGTVTLDVVFNLKGITDTSSGNGQIPGSITIIAEEHSA